MCGGVERSRLDRCSNFLRIVGRLEGVVSVR
jgi:hypothetical protein